MNVFVDGKEWYSGNVCCDEAFHFELQAAHLQLAQFPRLKPGTGIPNS